MIRGKFSYQNIWKFLGNNDEFVESDDSVSILVRLRHDGVRLSGDFRVVRGHVVRLEDLEQLGLRDDSVAFFVEGHESELELVFLASSSIVRYRDEELKTRTLNGNNIVCRANRIQIII